MNNWITILTFTLPHEAHLAKTKLQSEGFEVVIRDELTAQTNNFYSNAIGGVKLQIKEEDYKQAYKILKDLDYIKEEKQASNKTLTQIDNFLLKFPVINKLAFEIRLTIATALLVTLIVLPFAVLSLPNMVERISKNSWCIQEFSYLDKPYHLNTTGFKIVTDENCYETIRFDEDGDVYLPGLNTNAINARWKVVNGDIEIYNSDTLSYVFDGIYEVDIESKSIIIESKTTKIIGRKEYSIW